MAPRNLHCLDVVDVGRLDADDRRFLAVMEPGNEAARALLFSPDPIGRSVAIRQENGLTIFKA